MNNKINYAILFNVIICFSSCIWDPARPTNNDITIINSLPDSLYYFVHGYKLEEANTYNIAFDSIAAQEKSVYQYNIAYNISQNKILPHDTIHPSVMSSSWKIWAKEYGGLTILFYNRDIQKLPENRKLRKSDIFQRIDLTTKQLDSLKYVILLK
jgi:hypothetical protein